MSFKRPGRKSTAGAEKGPNKFDAGRRNFLKAGFFGTVAAVSLSLFAKIPLVSAFGLVEKAQLKNYSETLVSANSSTAYTVDLSNGNVFKITMTGNCTFTFSNPPASGKAGSFTLILVQDATGSRTATWPASVDWAGGTAPTLTTTASTGTDVLTFITTDGGTTWWSFAAGLDMR
jgi:FtsP/CotA-like multicopper oxidase with cupredoxin domain